MGKLLWLNASLASPHLALPMSEFREKTAKLRWSSTQPHLTLHTSFTRCTLHTACYVAAVMSVGPTIICHTKRTHMYLHNTSPPLPLPLDRTRIESEVLNRIETVARVAAHWNWIEIEIVWNFLQLFGVNLISRPSRTDRGNSKQTMHEQSQGVDQFTKREKSQNIWIRLNALFAAYNAIIRGKIGRKKERMREREIETGERDKERYTNQVRQTYIQTTYIAYTVRYNIKINKIKKILTLWWR